MTLLCPFPRARAVECCVNASWHWQVYERAIGNIPPAAEKRYWQRYIYLWINYALFEELEAQDAERTREVYRACLKLIPHKAFTFAKASWCNVYSALWRSVVSSVDCATLAIEAVHRHVHV